MESIRIREANAISFDNRVELRARKVNTVGFNSDGKVKGAQSFLSLEPPSCMVAPIRELRNKFTSSSSNTIHTLTNPPTMSSTNINSSLPTVSIVNVIGMDIPTGQAPVSDFEVREKNPVSSVNLSRILNGILQTVDSIP